MLKHILRVVPVCILLVSALAQSADGQIWEQLETVDEFGDDTGTKAIRGVFDGEMSNTAVNDAECKVKILVYENTPSHSFRIEVLEYNRSPATIFDWENYSLRAKDSSNRITEYQLQKAGKQFAISNTRDPLATDKFVGLILQGQEVKCVISEEKSRDSYSFVINGYGFREAMEPLIGEQMRALEEKEDAQRMKAEREAEVEKKKAEQREKMLAEAEQKRKEPMTFKTKDEKFSVVGLYLGSNQTHVRLQRGDNKTEVTVELKLLSDETLNEIKIRAIK